VHVLHQFEEDFYGETVRAIATGRVRGMEKFGSLEALIAAIDNDKRVALGKVAQLPHSSYREDSFFGTGSSSTSSTGSTSSTAATSSTVATSSLSSTSASH
jgi:Riboflavin kinase